MTNTSFYTTQYPDVAAEALVPGAVAYSDGVSVKFTSAGTIGQLLSSTGMTPPVWVNPAEAAGVTLLTPLYYSGLDIAIPRASSFVSGYLSNDDWLTFYSKEPALIAGATGTYLAGDKTWKALTSTSIGLPNVLNARQLVAASNLSDVVDAATARTNLGLATVAATGAYADLTGKPTLSTGSVTSVGGTGAVNGITLTGAVTAAGSLTLGGALSGVSLTTQVSGTLPIANGGTNATTAAAALTSLGAYAAINPAGYTTNTGTVTSVATTGTVNGITLTGSVTTSGTLTLGGTLSGVALGSQVAGTLPVANGGTGATVSTGTGSVVLATTPTLVTPVLGFASASRIVMAVGSVGSPTYTFAADTNTGIWSPAADTLAFSEGGVEAMRITSAGDVGIGVTDPGGYRLRLDSGTSSKLRLYNSVGNGNTIDFTDQGWQAQIIGTAGNILFNTGGTTERMRVTNTGEVGIGTTVPGAKLEVSSTSAGATVEVLRLSNPGGGANTAAQIKFFAAGANYASVTGGYGAAAPQMTFNLPAGAGNYVWQNASVEQMRLDASGNVGIGTSAPGYKLDVSATGNISGQFKTSGSINALFLADAGTTAETLYVGTVGNDFRVVTGSNERMRITSAGLVGIGTSAPVGRLMVAATDTSNTIGSATASINITNIDANAFGRTSNLNFTLDDGNITTRRLATISAVYTGFSGGSTAGALVFATQFNGSLNERMRIVEAGNVGIGTSAPAYQLQLSTDSAAKPSTNTWTIASDSRIKAETGEYTKGLDAVCALRPITYQYNGAAGFAVDGKENISIIAQEAMQHFPECVGTFEALLNEGDEEKTELFNWNGHALTFALVNAVKELKAANDALTARVAQLEGK